MSVVDFIKSLINPFKIDLVKYPSLDLRRREKLLRHHKISKILDVGANSGQYAEQIQKLGFSGEILSFEPVKTVFKVLDKKAKKKESWKAFNFGLGDKNTEMTINISENTYSSSILEIMPNHVKGAPESKVINKESITIKTLDSIFDELVEKDDVVFLKMDVQGFEKNVLEGAKNSIDRIHGIQIEMSVEELYKGEMLFLDTINLLKSFGYDLYSLENGFYDDASGKLLQVDGVFFK